MKESEENNFVYARINMEAAQEFVEIREEDEERRVYKLRMPNSIDFVPELILELDAPEVL